MPEYQIQLTNTAAKQLDKLPDNVVKRLISAIRKLASNPLPVGCKKLKGRDGYRIRAGDYRIIYDIFDDVLIVEVVALGHRKGIYG